MKYSKSQRVATALAIVAAAVLTGCGKRDNPVPGPGIIPGQPTVPGTGACLPITTQIGFTAHGIYMDSANIRGGQVPQGGAVGTIAIGGGAGGGPYQRSGVDGTISMNIVPQNVTTQPYPNYGYNPQQMISQVVNASGFIAISPQTQQDIMYQFGALNPGYGGYNPAYPGAMPQPHLNQQPCVSGIAIDVGHYNTLIHSGHVFLYMNRGQGGYVLYF